MHDDRGLMRCVFRLPSEAADNVMERANSLDMTMNEYVLRLIAHDMQVDYRDFVAEGHKHRKPYRSANAKIKHKGVLYRDSNEILGNEKNLRYTILEPYKE